jgi:CRISPR-associated protein Cmr4
MPETALILLHAQTPLHPGSGAALGVVDLPVQRERHTQWPVIPASSLKGVLRDACRERVAAQTADANGKSRRMLADADEQITRVFGPPTADADKHAGALSLTDARILAFPVRSLKGVFAWATTPPVLERLNRDLALAGFRPIGKIPRPGPERAACAGESPLLLKDGKMVLEEFEFARSEDADEVARWIAQHAVSDDATRKRIENHLVVLQEDDFTHFARHATEVVARVGLDYERKTVRRGALFYQEFLPAETIFYSLAIASKSRQSGDATTGAAILAFVRERVPAFLQIGGDETTGKGLCGVRFRTREG